MSMLQVKSCGYFPRCRGCDHWDQSYDLQKQTKIALLRTIIKEVDLAGNDFISVQPDGLRHRFDFTVETFTNASAAAPLIDDIQAENTTTSFQHSNRLSTWPEQAQMMGLYDAHRKLVDIENCLQLSPELQKVFSEFRAIPMRTKTGFIRKASVRLRVGPAGLKGVWLDLANVDIKALLDDSDYLSHLLEAGFEVELGQKGKKLGRTSLMQPHEKNLSDSDGVPKRLQGKPEAPKTKLKLTEPTPLAWFRSKSFILKSLISDFTQPSWLSAETLVDVVLGWVQDLSLKSAIEFGPGIGQFTLPLLEKGISLQVFENNPKAVEVLQQNAEAYGLEKNLQIFSGDFQNKPASLDRRFDLAFVNPPRSGLKNFVDTVIATQAKFCIYVSCFPESMRIDLEKLQQAGYRIHAAKIVDQFPQTKHFESCVLLTKP